MLDFALYFSSEVDIHAKQSNASWIPTTSKLFLVLIFFQFKTKLHRKCNWSQVETRGCIGKGHHHRFQSLMVKSASSTNVDKTILELVTLKTARHKELVMALCELGKEAEGSVCTGQI